MRVADALLEEAVLNGSKYIEVEGSITVAGYQRQWRIVPYHSKKYGPLHRCETRIAFDGDPLPETWEPGVFDYRDVNKTCRLVDAEPAK